MAKYVAESERLWLQPLSYEEHLLDFHAYISSAKGMEWSPTLPSQSLDETKMRLTTRSLPTAENPTRENYAILLKASVATSAEGKPKLIGTVGPYNVTADAAELGYGLLSEYWGKGYGSEAVKLFLEYYWSPGKDSKDVITAGIDPTNAASTALVTKLGFTKGEHLKSVYQLGTEVRDGVETKRDQVIWRLERPS